MSVGGSGAPAETLGQMEMSRAQSVMLTPAEELDGGGGSELQEGR